MPIKRISKSQVIEKQRKTSGDVISKSPEWREIQQIMIAGLKPHEAIEVDCSNIPTHSKVQGMSATRMTSHIRKEIKRLNAPFDCWAVRELNVVYLVGQSKSIS